MGLAGGLAANGQGGGGGGGGGSTSLKQVVFPLAADTSGNSTGFTGALQRFLLAFPAAPTQGRLRIANTGIAGTITLDDIYVGTPTYSNGTWNGGIAASPTKVLTAPTLSTDGSENITNWFDMTALWTAPDSPMVLSIDFTPASGVAQSLIKSSPMSWTRYRTTGSGLSGEVAATSPALGSLSNTTAFLDIRLEVQFTTGLRVVLCIGDSTTNGYNDTGDIPNAPGPMCAWPMLAGMKQRFLAINAGVGGTATGDWTSAANAKYARVLPVGASAPDDILINLGINDANGGVTAATYRTNLANVITAARSLSSSHARVWLGTVIQQPRFKAGVLMAAVAAAATTLQTSFAYANADIIDLDYEGAYGTKDAGLTVSGASAGTSAPFTTTVTAGIGHAHAPGAPVNVAASESRRLDYNGFIRKVPANVTGVFEFDAATCEPGRANVGDPRYWYGGATIHPGENAYVAMADQVQIPQ